VLYFARQEGKRRGGHNWWVLVAGDRDEGLETWRRVAASAAVVGQSSPRERAPRDGREKKRQRERSPLHLDLAWASVSRPKCPKAIL